MDAPQFGMNFGHASVVNFEPMQGDDPRKGACSGQTQSITVQVTSPYEVTEAWVYVATLDDPYVHLAGGNAVVTPSGGGWSMSASWTLPVELKSKLYYIELEAKNVLGKDVAWVSSIWPAR